MTNPQRQLSLAMHRVLDAVEGLSEDEFTKLVDSSYGIQIRLVRKRSKEVPGTFVAEEDSQRLIARLTSMSNRDEAQQFLDVNFGTRKSIEVVARRLDIPIMKQDKIEVLRDKVIEATVGARIRSETIQGANRQGGGTPAVRSVPFDADVSETRAISDQPVSS